jgi:hypothetical protein
MHSDVGGGYGVYDQGRGRLHTSSSKDLLSSEKLSQIPLEAMLKASQAAGVPLDPDLAPQQGDKGYDPFQVDDRLREAYAQFHAACIPSVRQPGDWLITYLAWRYQVLNTYTSLPWSTRIKADSHDKDDLVGANQTLVDDIRALERGATAPLATRLEDLERITFELAASMGSLVAAALPPTTASKLRKLAPEAESVLERLKAYAPVSAAEANLFATYAHDSYAGFRPYDHQFKVGMLGCHEMLPGSWEPEGYLRYRRFYTGSGEAHSYTLKVPEWRQEQEAVQTLINVKGYGVQDMFPPSGW